MNFKEINDIIGTREDVDNVLLDLNEFLLQNVGQFFTIGVGPDGPTATWSREWAKGNFPLMIFMQEVAAICGVNWILQLTSYREPPVCKFFSSALLRALFIF